MQTLQQSIRANLFKPSLLAWRESYLASKAATAGAQASAKPAGRKLKITRPGRQASGRSR